MITVDSVDLQPEAAFEVALANRLDFMNGRAALDDRWRQIQVTSDALQSNLTVTSSGDINTARDNPASLRTAKGNFRMGLQFDAPLTRLVERNTYRSSLITYQQSRREFIQSRDSLQKGLRTLIRTLEQRRRQLEIQGIQVLDHRKAARRWQERFESQQRHAGIQRLGCHEARKIAE